MHFEGGYLDFSHLNELTHYRMTILDSSYLKEFADDNFKFEENGRKLFKWVENTVGKGEIATFPTVFFKRLVTLGRQKVLLCGNGLKNIYH